MARYLYKARDSRGETVSGVVDAVSDSAAGAKLREEGKVIVSLREVRDGEFEDAPTMSLTQHARRVKRDDVIYFSHQMAVMVETGVPLGEALDSLTQQTDSPHFRAVMEDVTSNVQAGASLSSSLARHPRVFPDIMVSLLEASEASGTMGEMLERISTYLSKERATMKKVRGAMMYPAFMLAMAIGVTMFLVMFVMPRFASIYGNRGAALPLPTRVLLGTSNFMTHYWWAWGSGLVVAIVTLVWFSRTPGGRIVFDRLKLSTPIIGPMMRQLYLTRAMQTMGTMVAAGVPMLDMIAITRRVTQNVLYEELWDEVDERLRHGQQLSDPLSESDLIPRSISRMIASGEKAGRLGQVMQKIASFTEADFDESVIRATQFIEPVMVSVMGVIIGGVAVSLLLPVFSIGKVMAGN